MAIANQTVQAVEKKMIPGKTDKFGKPLGVWVMIINGERYNVGFKKPAVESGDVVSFNHAEKNYGEFKVDMATLVVGGTPMTAPAPTASTSSRGGYQSKPFPVPLDHGDRSIIRQNSLTNARELISITLPYMELTGTKPIDLNEVASEIIRVASIFEKYSAGDYEREAADEIMGGE